MLRLGAKVIEFPNVRGVETGRLAGGLSPFELILGFGCVAQSMVAHCQEIQIEWISVAIGPSQTLF
jgi:hypothetical protein